MASTDGLKTRIQPSDALTDRVTDYCGFECAATGLPWEELHHLDDDRNNTRAGNLVPVTQAINRELFIARNSADRGERPLLPNELAPRQLWLRSQMLFWQWKLGPAYSSARLGYFVSKNLLKEVAEQALPLACQALYITRYRLDYELMLDVLDQDILRTLRTEKLSEKTRALLIREVAGLFAEHGLSGNAAEVYERLGARERRCFDAREQAGLLRREATAAGAVHGNYRRSAELLDEALGLAGGEANLAASVLNSKAWLALAAARPADAMELLEPVIAEYRKMIFPRGARRSAAGPRPVAVTAWNAAELFHNYAIAVSHCRPRDFRRRRARALADARAIYSQTGAKPYEILPEFSSWVVDDELAAAQAAAPEVFSCGRIPARVLDTIAQVLDFLRR
ncbi:MAG: hypothetical protein ACREQZ_04240 [Woeseiaceae bacterium]